MKKKSLYKIILLAITLVGIAGSLISCNKDDFEYNSQYECYFIFNTNFHVGSLIEACVNPLSSGQFCIVRKSEVNGVRHLKVQLYGGQSEDITITTEEEKRVSCVLGCNNGLIIGRSTLNDGELYAFDIACPNCLVDYYYKDLQWAGNGQTVKCPKCNQTYNLNNSGFPEGENGQEKLLRYRASYVNPYLRVGNYK